MKVLLFARARDLIGADAVEVEGVATVGHLRRALMQRYPGLAGLLEKSAFAVADEFACDEVALAPESEVALLPPVSGG